MSGVLTLVPTPIDDEGILESCAKQLLENASTEGINESIFVIEDLKPGRRRWLKWGLTRDIVDDFVLYNEHSAKEVSEMLLSELKKCKNVYLMSDGGLPAFCDPGVELVNLCHKNKIKVTSTPFANSISLALAMSGFSHRKFNFEGFLSKNSEERLEELKVILSNRRTSIIMDTPYRMKRLLEDIKHAMKSKGINREVFLAMDLNTSTEQLLRGTPEKVLGSLKEFKREFILIVSESLSEKGKHQSKKNNSNRINKKIK